MAKYETVTRVYETKNKTDYLREPGTEIEVSDEDAERLLKLGAIKRIGESADEVSAEEDDLVLPARPSNGASKEVWRKYLTTLDEATKDELDPLEVPDDATRDQMIAIGDARLAELED